MTDADKLLLENYFADRLTPAERTAVDQRVANDSAFAAAFRERQRMEDYLSYRAQGGATPELITQLGAEAFGTKKKQHRAQLKYR